MELPKGSSASWLTDTFPVGIELSIVDFTLVKLHNPYSNNNNCYQKPKNPKKVCGIHHYITRGVGAVHIPPPSLTSLSFSTPPPPADLPHNTATPQHRNTANRHTTPPQRHRNTATPQHHHNTATPPTIRGTDHWQPHTTTNHRKSWIFGDAWNSHNYR